MKHIPKNTISPGRPFNSIRIGWKATGQFTLALRSSYLCLALVVGFAGLLATRAAAGSWTPVTALAPDNIDTMLLLSDGTVMAASGSPLSGQAGGNAWYRLTPDTNGSYANGKWSTLSPMHDTRLYYASQVLQDGRVFIAGAEYGSGGGTAEVYDPVNNTWTETAQPTLPQTFLDNESRMLPNGNVLVSPVIPTPSGTCIIYNPTLNIWTSGGTLVRGGSLDEASWIKLPDDSILTLDTPGTGTNSERFIPSLNQWVDDATLPVSPWDLTKFEMGAGLLLPDGRGFYLGSSGHTVFYQPSGSSSPGSFTAGPDIPNSQGTADAPAAMMATGRILCAFGPNGTVGGATNYPGPTTYYEFDPVSGIYTAEPTPTGFPDLNPPYPDRMLDLPDGSVLFSSTSQQVYIYRPIGAPVASGKPTIISLTANGDGSFHLVGTLLNGISQGAAYGDDAQMDSNYPIIRLTDAFGRVFYVRTFNWSSTGVMTGSTAESTDFRVPLGVPPGQYTLTVIANGISSDAIGFTASGLAYVSNTISDGNGNGMIDPNECNSMEIVITNASSGPATGIIGTLSSTTPGVTIAAPTAAFTDLPLGGVGTNTTAFRVSTSPVFICGTTIGFSLVVKSDQITTSNFFTVNTGTLGAPVRFDSDTLVNIPDNNPAGTNSIIVVSNLASALAHVSVSLNIIHPFVSDLTLQLISPDGTAVVLAQNVGGSGQDFGVDCTDPDRTTFDDAIGSPIGNGTPPYIGTFMPQQPLAAFNGKSGGALNGGWQLQMVDGAAGDVGFLQCWSLILTPANCEDGGGQCPGIDLALGMTAAPNPVVVQSNLTYTLTVTNNGPDTAKDVSINQTLPPSVIFVSANASQGDVNFGGGAVSCNVGTLVVGGTATVTVVVSPQSPGTIFSTATVGALEQDLNPFNNTVTVSTVVKLPSADLSVELSANPSPVLLNGLLTYTTLVVNNGPAVATNVLVTNTLPVNVALVSTAASQGDVVSMANIIVAFLGTLNPGSNATVTIQVQPLVLGTIAASSLVSSGVPDPVLGNNTSSVKVNVTAAADLALTLVGPNAAVVGSNLTYTITALNAGPSTATGVSIKDTLPAGVSLVSAVSPQGPCTLIGSVVTCQLTNNLAVTATATVTITVSTATPALAGVTNVTLVDVASVSGAQGDPNIANNSATVSTVLSTPIISVVAAGFDLEIEGFQPPNGMIDPGETVTMLFRLQNVGNVDSANNLTATLLSTGGVTPVGTQSQIYGALTVGGAAVSEPFTFVANGTNGGTITASLQLVNAGTNLSVVKFSFSLPNTNSFANTNTIIIPDHGPGVPSPSTNLVSGVTGLIGKVTVTMTNVNHTFPDDIDILLVGPKGQNVLLMSHAGFNGVLNDVALTFDDGATNSVGAPNFLPSATQILSGSYVPTQYGAVNFTNTFNGTIVISSNNPPPLPPYGTNLAVFNGTTANGTWLLYVFDSAVGDQGQITGGWSLGISAGSEVNPVVDLGVTGKASTNSVVAGANLTYTFTITNNGPNLASTVQFTNVLPTNVTFVSATNSARVVTSTNGGGAVYCMLTNLPTGSNVTVTVVVTANAAGTIKSQASVTGSDSDPNQSNNSTTVVTTATAPVADLLVTMTGSTNAVIGSNATYTVTVTNKGPGAAVGVVVTDPLLGVLNFVSGNSSVGSATVISNNGSALCNLGNLALNASATVTFILSSPQAITITNVVTATTTSTDTNLANNTASVPTTFTQPMPVIVATGARLLNGPANGTIVAGQAVTVSLQLANIGSADTVALTATLLAGNGVILAGGTNSSVQSYGALAHGGPSIAETFSFTASGGNGGVIVATLQLADQGTNLPAVSFTFDLPATNTYANTGAIIIPDHGPASPYPAVINISGVTGLVNKATVTLSNLSHQFANDVQVLLQGPAGQSVVLMAGVGGGHPVTNITLTFDDAASNSLPSSSLFAAGLGQLMSGTNKPTNDGLGQPFASPAPAGPSAGVLATFIGTNPNGAWTLYVYDNSPGDSGDIANGWSLTLEEINPVNSAADLAVGLAKSVASLSEGGTIVFTVSVTNKGPADAANVTISDPFQAGLNFTGTSLGSSTVGTNGAILFNLGSLASGSNTSFTISASPAVTGTFGNSVTVTSDQTDLNLSDNLAQVSFDVTLLPKLSATAGLANGAFALTLAITGPLGTYDIMASTNLAVGTNGWTVAGMVTNSLGTIQFTDTNAANFPARYYRAVLVP